MNIYVLLMSIVIVNFRNVGKIFDEKHCKLLFVQSVEIVKF